MVALTWAAAHTRAIRLGVSVLIMPFYQPLVLAKQLATLDVMAAGRLDVGVGIGWSLDEFEAAGVPRDRRGAPRRRVPACPQRRLGRGSGGVRG